MKLSMIIAAAASVFASTATAQNAIVQNNCLFPVYVQSFPYDNGTPGTLTKLASGASYQEKYYPQGSTVKMSKSAEMTKPLIYGYSFSSNPATTYYELSTRFGNPFSAYKVNLGPTTGVCKHFNCAAGAAKCYSTPTKQKVYHCTSPVNVAATLC